MTKKDLLNKMSEKSGLSQKDCDKALAAFTESVTEELKAGGSLQLVGFGTFGVASRAERKGRNPRTGEETVIPASRSAKFSPSKNLKKI